MGEERQTVKAIWRLNAKRGLAAPPMRGLDRLAAAFSQKPINNWSAADGGVNITEVTAYIVNHRKKKTILEKRVAGLRY